ncbi:rap guanine nucleotide exchange factor 6-like [Schistocerca nitens]|uniref:rap guanine nucleotide exchange factor 6-like n=1 Tax=Schistocerca nitens TaxID=7011 RepID=UPI0021179964|nr:rap guanine nucleotide exchange factor 6-like [Schistocerca nitens]
MRADGETPFPPLYKGPPPCAAMDAERVDPAFCRALRTDPCRRSIQDLQVIYYGLRGLEALSAIRDSVLRAMCRAVRYERHDANDVLYYTGELSTCWYILLSGSVFIDGSMFLPRSRSVRTAEHTIV